MSLPDLLSTSLGDQSLSNWQSVDADLLQCTEKFLVVTIKFLVATLFLKLHPSTCCNNAT